MTFTGDDKCARFKTNLDYVEIITNEPYPHPQADDFTRANAGSKLSVIAEQVRFLQEQVRSIQSGCGWREL